MTAGTPGLPHNAGRHMNRPAPAPQAPLHKTPLCGALACALLATLLHTHVKAQTSALTPAAGAPSNTQALGTKPEAPSAAAPEGSQSAQAAIGIGLLTGQCPATFPTPTPAQAQAAHLLKLADQAEICDARADYFAYRGSLLLMAGRLAEAATNLEKALLIDPELPGAQLDFAQALAQLGQKEAALQLVDQVGGRKDIDPDLRQWLTHFQTPTKTHAWAWSAMLQTSLGHETNLDSASHTDTLTLQLSNGPVIVDLADTDRPVAGKGIKNWVAVQGLHPLGEGEIRLTGAVQSRNTPGTALGSSDQIDAALTYAHPAGPGIASFRLSGLHYDKENAYTYKENSAQLKYEPAWRPKNCPWSLSWGRADQQHQTTPTMSGVFQYTRIEGSCKNTIGGVSALHLSQGTDRAQDPTRPGGNKQRTEYGFRHDQALDLWHQPAQLSLWLRHHNSRDSAILSPLLGSTIVNTHRTDIGLGYWWRLHKQWSIGIDLERTRQTSNSELSQLKNTLVYTGIRWSSE